jgi:small subunit ribosomal protein S14
MAKTSVVERNKKRERMVKQFADKRAELKKAVSNTKLSLQERMQAQDKLTKLPRNSNPVRLRNRCSQTGRPRGYMGFFGVSRMVFRDLASFGLLPGVRKASW